MLQTRAPNSWFPVTGPVGMMWNWACFCFQYTQSAECKGHAGPVCAVDAVYVDESNILVASAASDSTVRLWLCSEAKEGK